MAAGQAFFFVIQFGGTIVLARILSPYEMGVYAVAAALVGVLTLLQAFGLNNFIIREPDLSPDQVATAFTMNIVTAGLLSLLIVGAGLNAHHWFPDPGVAKVLIAMSVLPLISIFHLVPSAQLERRGAFHLLVAVNMTRQVTATCCTVGFALTGHSFLSLPYGQLCGGVAGVLLLNVLGRQYAQFSLSVRNWRRVLTFGGQMMAIAGVNTLATRASEILLGRIAGLQSLGLYNRASTLFTLFWENLHLIIGRVLFVDLAERRRNGESLRGPYLRIAEVMTATLWPAFLGLAILSRPLMALIYGERWLPAAIPFSILALSAVIQLSVTMTWELFTVSGETGRQVRIESLRTAVGTALFAAGSFFGIAAAASARVLDAIFSMLLYRPHVERMTDTVLGDLMPIYGRSAVLSLVAVAPAGGWMVATGGSYDRPIWQLAAVILAGAVGWVAALILMKHPICDEARRVLRVRLAR